MERQFRYGLKLALCEKNLFRWAWLAPPDLEFFCPRCGTEVFLDQRRQRFTHPDCSYCCESLANKKTALLFLHSLLQSQLSSLQIVADCRTCQGSDSLDLVCDAEIGAELVRPCDTAYEVIRVPNLDHGYYLAVHPIPPSAQHWLAMQRASWFSLDARNILNGGLLIPIGSAGMPLQCRNCSVLDGDQGDQVVPVSISPIPPEKT